MQVQDIELGSSIDGRALQELWEDEMMCDVICRAGDGQTAKAHKVLACMPCPQGPGILPVPLRASVHFGVLLCDPSSQLVLAVSSPFFRALFVGAGANMQEVEPGATHTLKSSLLLPPTSMNPTEPLVLI